MEADIMGITAPPFLPINVQKSPLKKGNHRKYQAMPTSDEL